MTPVERIKPGVAADSAAGPPDYHMSQERFLATLKAASGGGDDVASQQAQLQAIMKLAAASSGVEMEERRCAELLQGFVDQHTGVVDTTRLMDWLYQPGQLSGKAPPPPAGPASAFRGPLQPPPVVHHATGAESFFLPGSQHDASCAESAVNQLLGPPRETMYDGAFSRAKQRIAASGHRVAADSAVTAGPASVGPLSRGPGKVDLASEHDMIASAHALPSHHQQLRHLRLPPMAAAREELAPFSQACALVRSSSSMQDDSEVGYEMLPVPRQVADGSCSRLSCGSAMDDASLRAKVEGLENRLCELTTTAGTLALPAGGAQETEAEVQELRGQVEELTGLVRQLCRSQQQLQEQADSREVEAEDVAADAGFGSQEAAASSSDGAPKQPPSQSGENVSVAQTVMCDVAPVEADSPQLKDDAATDAEAGSAEAAATSRDKEPKQPSDCVSVAKAVTEDVAPAEGKDDISSCSEELLASQMKVLTGLVQQLCEGQQSKGQQQSPPAQAAPPEQLSERPFPLALPEGPHSLGLRRGGGVREIDRLRDAAARLPGQESLLPPPPPCEPPPLPNNPFNPSSSPLPPLQAVSYVPVRRALQEVVIQTEVLDEAVPEALSEVLPEALEEAPLDHECPADDADCGPEQYKSGGSGGEPVDPAPYLQYLEAETQAKAFAQQSQMQELQDMMQRALRREGEMQQLVVKQQGQQRRLKWAVALLAVTLLGAVGAGFFYVGYTYTPLS
eukprot:TRINITY_DN26770_c0_g1_i1.p1 TRINITY_DN26770_c0_g1~~TRINITY_DN26770_c0_g1_i1.p1  ORF type:complete len:736 (+),score=191.31 TRINITY_DN26770_c0_g1_i1:83-2290(+)